MVSLRSIYGSTTRTVPAGCYAGDIGRLSSHLITVLLAFVDAVGYGIKARSPDSTYSLLFCLAYLIASGYSA